MSKSILTSDMNLGVLLGKCTNFRDFHELRSCSYTVDVNCNFPFIICYVLYWYGNAGGSFPLSLTQYVYLTN